VGLAFVLLVWAFIAVVGIACWLGCVAFFFIACFKRWRLAAILSLVPIIGAPIAVLALAGLTAVLVGMGFSPRNAYRETFHESATADVRELSGFKFGVADGDWCYLRFQAGPDTVAHLVKKGQLSAIPERTFREETDRLDLKPRRWRPFDGDPKEFYAASQFNGLSGSDAYLSYDPASRWVHFAWTQVQ
jgi:hypothetical protein